MQLLADWKTVLRKAWSVRLLLVAAALSAIEVGLTFVREFLPVPPGWFAVASIAITFAALYARLVAQNSMRDRP